MTKNKTLKILLSFLAVYIIWGTTYLAIRVIVDSAPPFISMGIRFLIAGTLIYLYLLVKGETKISAKELKNSALIGVLLFTGGVGLVAWAEKYVPSGITSVIVSLLPLWFLLFDMILNKAEKPKPLVWLGVIVGFAGIIMLVGFKDLTSLRNIPYLPFIIIILSTIIWSFGAVLGPKLKRPKNNLLNLCIQMMAGGLSNSIIGLMGGEMQMLKLQLFTFEVVMGLLYLIVFGSIIALSAFTYLIENVKPGMVSTYSYVNPVVALFFGWLILNEEINSQIIIASFLILVGVAFIKLGDIQLTPGLLRNKLVRWLKTGK